MVLENERKPCFRVRVHVGEVDFTVGENAGYWNAIGGYRKIFVSGKFFGTFENYFEIFF